MSLEELGSKLRDLDNTRRIAERELAALKDHRRRVQDLEQDRDALLESMAEMVPEALDSLTGEEKGLSDVAARSYAHHRGVRYQRRSLYFCNPVRMRSRPNSNSAS